MTTDDRKDAFVAAKAAVNAYSKDPTDENAARVQSAWMAVKDLQATPIWRQQFEMWLQSDPDPDDDIS